MQFKFNKLLPIFIFLLSFILVVPIINVSAAPDGSYIPDFKSEPLEGGVFRVYDGDSFENSQTFYRVDWTNSFNTSLSFEGAHTKQTFEAKANPGYEFVGWYDDKGLVSTDNPYKSGKTINNNIVAKFEKLDDNQIATTFTGFIDVSSDFIEFNTGNEWLSIVSDSESEETNNSDQQYAVVKSQVDFELENDGLLMFDWFWCGFVPDKRYSVSYTLYKDGESFVSGDLSQEYYAIFRAYPGGVLIDNPKSESISLSKGSYLLEFSFNDFYIRECEVVVQDLIVKETNDISNSYSVSLPKTLDVSQNTTTFDVKVSNNDLWNVSVTMPNKITLNDQAVKDNKPKDPIDVNVEFENGVFNKDETRVATLTHNGISSGNWKADMNVNIFAESNKTYDLVDGISFSLTIMDYLKSHPSKTDVVIIFTDSIKPSVADEPESFIYSIDGLDADGDGGIVAWADTCIDTGVEVSSLTERDGARCVFDNSRVNIYISSQKEGQKIYANPNCTHMFSSILGISFDFSNIDFSKTTDMTSMFRDSQIKSSFDVSNWNVKRIEIAYGMFKDTSFIDTRSLDLSSWDFSNVTDMDRMFSGINVEQIKTPKNIPNNLSRIFNTITDTWYDVTDNYKEYRIDTFPVGFAESHTLVREIPKKYSITYDTQGGTMPDNYPTEYWSGEGLNQLPTPTKDGFEFLGWNALVDIESDESYLKAGEGIINALLDKADTYYLINDSIDFLAGEEPEIDGSDEVISILDKNGDDVTNEGNLLKLNDKYVFKTPKNKEKAPYSVTFRYNGMTPNTDVSDFITDYYIFDDTDVIKTYDDILIDTFDENGEIETKTLNIDVGNNDNAYLYFDYSTNHIQGGRDKIILNNINVLTTDYYAYFDSNYLFKLDKGINELCLQVEKGRDPTVNRDIYDTVSILHNIKVLNNPFVIDSIPVGTKGDVAIKAIWNNNVSILISGPLFKDILDDFEANGPKVTKIEFVEVIPEFGSEYLLNRDLWDVSEAQDGSIMMWADKPKHIAEDKTLYISGNGMVQANKDCSTMFSFRNNLKSIEFNNLLDTGNTTNMGGMFSEMATIKSLNLSSFNTSKVDNTSNMFSFSSCLETIYISDLWNMNNVLNDAKMFDIPVSSLVGGSGTVYDDTKTDKSMANYHDGYLTHIKQHRIIVDDEDVPYLPEDFPKYYMTGEGLDSIPEPIGRDGYEFLGWRGSDDKFDEQISTILSVAPGEYTKKVAFNEDVIMIYAFDDTQGQFGLKSADGKGYMLTDYSDKFSNIIKIAKGTYSLSWGSDSYANFTSLIIMSDDYIDSISANSSKDIYLKADWQQIKNITIDTIKITSDDEYEGVFEFPNENYPLLGVNIDFDSIKNMNITFEDGYGLDWDSELSKIESGDYTNIIGLEELLEDNGNYLLFDVSAIKQTEYKDSPEGQTFLRVSSPDFINEVNQKIIIPIYFDATIKKWRASNPYEVDYLQGYFVTEFDLLPDVVNRTPFDIDYGKNTNFIEGQDIPSEYYVGRGTKLPELVMSQEGVEPFFEKYHYGWYIQGFTTDVNDSSFTIPDDVIGNIKLMAVESNRYIGSRMKFDINGGNPIEDDDLSTPDIYDQIFYTKDGLNVSDMRVPTHPDGLDFKGWFSPYPVKVTINDNDENGDIIGNGTELITKTINGSYTLESTETTKSNYLMHLVFDSTNSSYEFESITYTLNGNVVYSYNGSFDDEIIDLWLFVPIDSDYVVDVKVKEKDGALEPFKSAEMLLEEFFDINDIKPETQNYYYLARAFYGDYKESFISEDQIKTGADLEIFDEPVTYAFNSISSNEPNDGKFIIIEDMSQLSEGKFDDISISNSVTIESYMVDDVDTELDNTTIEDDNNSSNENDDNENKDLGNGDELDKPSESESPDINVDTDSDDEIIPSPSPSPDTNLPTTTPTDKSEEDDLDVESDITELVDDSVVQS